MNFDVIKSVGSKAANTKVIGRGILLGKKYSPQILTTVGIVGVVASGVFACKATLNVEPVIDEMSAGVQAAKMRRDNIKDYPSEAYTADITKVYVKGGLDLVKLYGPSVTLGLSSIACIIGAHQIMSKRHVAVVAAYKTLEQSFGEYRKRVVEDLGIDKDKEYLMGTSQAVVVGKDGKDEEVTILDPNGISAYAKYFDEFNANWSKDPEYNLMFLKTQQNYANDRLNARGHLFLNEVYDMLGMEHTKAGAVTGWVYSDKGDNFVDFGIYNPQNDMAREFVNGFERSILLDFNVDGIILDRF